ncbi:MAG: hypothetical protein HW411_1254 [Gammaproteobacteria bacterium]|nr:hypothetical protein [Gammaproteobacteria bacterium]
MLQAKGFAGAADVHGRTSAAGEGIRRSSEQEVETRREQRSRRPIAVAQDAYTARIVPYNPFAFPPSMEVRCRWYDYMDVIGRVESGTETETTSGTSCLQDVGKGRKQERKLCRATLTPIRKLPPTNANIAVFIPSSSSRFCLAVFMAPTQLLWSND